MFSFEDMYVRSYQSFKASRILDPEHESTKIIQDVGNFISSTWDNITEGFNPQQYWCKNVKIPHVLFLVEWL